MPDSPTTPTPEDAAPQPTGDNFHTTGDFRAGNDGLRFASSESKAPESLEAPENTALPGAGHGRETEARVNLDELTRSDSTFVSAHETARVSASDYLEKYTQRYDAPDSVIPVGSSIANPNPTATFTAEPAFKAPSSETGHNPEAASSQHIAPAPQPPLSESDPQGTSAPATQPADASLSGISRKEIRKSYQAQVIKIFFKDMLIVIFAAMVLTLVLKTFVFQPFGVPSSSMEDTLKPDDRILVSKISLLRGVQRGDVVVFRDTKGWLRGDPLAKTPDNSPFSTVLKFIGFAPEDNDEYLVKRVIGIPGDKVSCKGGNAPLLVNGQEISTEPYLKPGAAHSSFSFEVTVPEGQIWVMGDNRPVSADSRLNTDKPGKGFIDEKDVVGIVFMRVWPQNRFGFLEDERKVFADVPKDPPSGDSK